MVRVKDFIASHDRHQILRLRQIDDVVRPARDHVDSLDLITGNLKLHRFASVDIAFLNQTVTSHHNEQFPLGVVPMLALGDARTADVDGHLPTICSMNKFRERATVVHIHFEGILELVRGQISQIQRIEFLGKGAIRHFGHHEC